mgnify:FL=1
MTKGISNMMEQNLRKQAADKLISQQKCSRTKTKKYSIICYGDDLNTLDATRKWLYEEGLNHNMTTEQARIFANKLVLYVDPQELEIEFQHLVSKAVVSA